MDATLADMLSAEFTTEEQQRFLKHFQMYLVHGEGNTKHVIHLDDVFEWMGYARKDHAKRSLVKNFAEDTDFSVVPQQRGTQKETIMMSVFTFKVMCMISNTSRGKMTQRYYVKLEDLFSRCAKKMAMIEYEHQLNQKVKETEAITHHTSLLLAMKNESGVYIGMVEPCADAERLLIKIGSAQDIASRVREHTVTYDTWLLMHVWKCGEFRQFERYMIQNALPYQYKGETSIGRKHNEVFEMSHQELLDLIEKGNNAVHKFKKHDPHEIELRRIDLEIERERTKQLTMQFNSEGIMTKAIPVPISSSTEPFFKARNVSRGPKVQVYSEDGITLIKTYATFIEAIRDRCLNPGVF